LKVLVLVFIVDIYFCRNDYSSVYQMPPLFPWARHFTLIA